MVIRVDYPPPPEIENQMSPPVASQIFLYHPYILTQGSSFPGLLSSPHLSALISSRSSCSSCLPTLALRQTNCSSLCELSTVSNLPVVLIDSSVAIGVI